jgi:signal transduction histidine kinase
MEAATSIAKAWEQAKQEPLYLDDEKFRRKMDGHIDRLLAAKQTMTQIIEDFLSRVEQTQENKVDVVSCVKGALNATAHVASTGRIRLVFDGDEWLPDARGNHVELGQVFLNILLNAIQQMPCSGRSRGRITIKTRHVPEDKAFPIQVRFTDTGPGIHNRYLGQIFEPMFTTKEKGMGMGLYICQELLALMGGRIRVEQTAILAGTTFLVELRQAHKGGDDAA